MRASVLMSLMALIILALGCQTHRQTEGVPNFNVVDHRQAIYRGGQPTCEGWQYLRSIGVIAVVKLNPKSEGIDDCSLGGLCSPISFEQQIGIKPISQAEILQDALSIIPGTYIHCQHGQDRTGLICAIYRVKVDGWTKEQAEAEMFANGFHKELAGLWKAWQDFKP